MSSKEPYCPDQFDVIWLNFDPQAGREQAGRRPAFVLSPQKYNQIARLCILCPITTKANGYPFQCVIPDGMAIEGAIISDQIKSLSWAERNASFIANCPELAPEVLGKLKALIPF